MKILALKQCALPTLFIVTNFNYYGYDHGYGYYLTVISSAFNIPLEEKNKIYI